MISPEKEQVLELFRKGRRHYKLREFREAYTCFTEALKIDPKDGPSELYRKRCVVYAKSPPPEEWDGVYTATTK